MNCVCAKAIEDWAVEMQSIIFSHSARTGSQKRHEELSQHQIISLAVRMWFINFRRPTAVCAFDGEKE